MSTITSGPFDALHGRVHDFVHVPDVLVVNRVAFGLAHLLENDLLRKLRGDAAENSFGHLRDQQLAASFRARIELARLLYRHLQIGIFDLLRSSRRSTSPRRH